MIGPVCALIMANTISIDSQFSMLVIVYFKKKNSNKKTFHYQILILTFTYSTKSENKIEKNFLPFRSIVFQNNLPNDAVVCLIFILNQKRFTVKRNVK